MAVLAPQGAGWQLTFENGAMARAEVLIGADGANSRIRPLLTPIRPFYAGITVGEGALLADAQNAPVLFELIKGGEMFATNGAQTLISNARGGRLSCYAGCKTEALWARNSGLG